MKSSVGVIALLVALMSTSAMAGSSAGYGMGGQFDRFDPVINQFNQSGELFRIEGHCQSACTMFLAIKNVCVEPSATLLFHAGKDRSKQITVSATNHMLNTYNSALRDYLVSNHYMDTLTLHAIPGREVIKRFGYRECPKK